MTRSTPSDEAFKRRVAKEFLKARNKALADGFSMEDFVAKLGITRAAFHKHVTGKSIPSLRVLAKAKRYWGVQLSYDELGDVYVKTRKKDPRQAVLQFSFGDISKDQIEITRVSPKGDRSLEVLIRINLSKSA